LKSKISKKYKLFGYIILPFNSLKNYKKFVILSLRNNRNIRKYMQNTNIIQIKEHIIFLIKLKRNLIKYEYFIVYKSGFILGVFYLKMLKNKCYEFGIYLNPKLIGKSKGKTLLKIIEKIAKSKYKAKKFLIFVKQNNIRAIKFYKKHNFFYVKENEKYTFLEKKL